MRSEGLMLGACLVLGLVAWLLGRRTKPLRIDAHGLLIRAAFTKPRAVAWAEIDGFGVATVARTEGGLYESSTDYVGIRLKDLSTHRTASACVTNRRMSGYDILLVPERGFSVAQFVEFLERAKTRFAASDSGVGRPS